MLAEADARAPSLNNAQDGVNKKGATYEHFKDHTVFAGQAD